MIHMIGKVMIPSGLLFAKFNKTFLSIISSKIRDTDKNLFSALKLHVSIQNIIISYFLSINQNSINTVLIKKPIYGFNNNLVSLKKLDFMIGYFILLVKKVNKLSIKLLTLLKIKKLDHNSSTKLS